MKSVYKYSIVAVAVMSLGMMATAASSKSDTDKPSGCGEKVSCCCKCPTEKPDKANEKCMIESQQMLACGEKCK
ncbi:MAG: hypothetical protein JXM68_06920, partial [Sedimentisphaerales bacterium]|nr:hypothetical protein [Sedimentisphaerales bacterium]